MENGYYRTLNQGKEWEFFPSDLPPNYFFFLCLDTTYLYGLFGNGSERDAICLSKDLGDTWELLSWFSYPTAMTCLLGDFVVSSRETGVWRSKDQGVTWEEMNQGLSNPHVLCLSLISPWDSLPYPLAGTEGGVFIYNP